MRGVAGERLRRVRLALCSLGELFGGVERQVLDLCTFLNREGLGPEVVVLFHDHELARQLRERGNAAWATP